MNIMEFFVALRVALWLAEWRCGARMLVCAHKLFVCVSGNLYLYQHNDTLRPTQPS